MGSGKVGVAAANGGVAEAVLAAASGAARVGVEVGLKPCPLINSKAPQTKNPPKTSVNVTPTKTSTDTQRGRRDLTTGARPAAV